MLLILFLWIFLSPTQLKDAHHFDDSFVIWNVGQGQWITYNTLTTCYHFDVGGEFFPLRKIKQLCRDKQNELYISHWDFDHLSGLKHLANWSRVCRRQDPLGTAAFKKMKLLAHFPFCQDPPHPEIKLIFPLKKEQGQLPDISNAQSQVFLFKNWLIPGDSRQEEEKIWSLRVPDNVKALVVGHHGSRTSSSPELIRRIPKLQWAIISARWRRYKHPHPLTLLNFSQQKKRVLRTEDWGNFRFESLK